jgi:hypothetical protein
MGHVLLDKRDERGEACARIPRAGQFDDNSQGTASFSAGRTYCRDIVGGPPGRSSRHGRQGQQAEAWRGMKELLRSNDPVLLSFVSTLLEEANIAFIVLDTNMSVLEGSLGILPRRVLVEEDCVDRARKLLTEAGVGHDIDGAEKS